VVSVSDNAAAPGPLLILGSGRSGTTWILDVIADAAQLRPIYEPLHPVAVPAARELANRALGADDDVPEMSSFMDMVFSGRLRSAWTDYRVRGDRLRLGAEGKLDIKKLRMLYRTARHLVENYRRYRGHRRRAGVVVKCIRANLMMPWLVRHYRPRILFVVRHPCAVIASRLKAGAESWALDGPFQQDVLRRYREQTVVMERVRRAGLDLMDPGLSEATIHAILWCIENVEPLREARELGCTIAYYEALAGADEQAWAPIFEGLGLDVRPDSSLLRRPSEQASPERVRAGFGEAVQPKWRSWLSAEQVADIGRVLEGFGFHDYSVDAAAPVVRGCRG